MAVVSAPALGRRWWAERGGGAWVASERGRAHPRLFGRRPGGRGGLDHLRPRDAGRLAALVARAWASRGFSDFWQHCLVAEGAVEIAAESGLQLWDYAAIQLLVEEAGGLCTTFDGT